MTNEEHNKFMRLAIEMSENNVRSGTGGPFGAVIVKDGVVMAKGCNLVTANNDPTAHAEVSTIRLACAALQTFDLSGCIIYTSCEPCPMCLGAIYWARIDKIFYGNTKKDAADIGFDDQFIYKELDLPMEQRKLPISQMMRDESIQAFQLWEKTDTKTEY